MPAAPHVLPCYESRIAHPEPAFHVRRRAQSQPTPTAAETDPETLGFMQGFPPPPKQNHHFPQRFVPQLSGIALGLEQYPSAGADGKCLARGRAGVGVAARGARYRRVCVRHHGRAADDVRAHAGGNLCRWDRRAASGQADLRALFRRAETAQAAYLDVGDKILHRHAGRNAGGGGQDRSAGAGDGIHSRVEGRRVR